MIHKVLTDSHSLTFVIEFLNFGSVFKGACFCMRHELTPGRKKLHCKTFRRAILPPSSGLTRVIIVCVYVFLGGTLFFLQTTHGPTYICTTNYFRLSTKIQICLQCQNGLWSCEQGWMSIAWGGSRTAIVYPSRCGSSEIWPRSSFL